MKKLTLKATFLSPFSTKRADGTTNTGFIYSLTGTPEALAAYRKMREDKGSQVREDDNGNPTWVTSFDKGDVATLHFKRDMTGVYVDNTQEQRMISTLNQYSSNALLADKLATLVAQELMAKHRPTPHHQVASVVQPVNQEQPEPNDETMGDL